MEFGSDDVHVFGLSPQTRGAVLGTKVKDAERFGRECDPVADGQARPGEQVLAGSNADGKAADGVQGLFADCHGRRTDRRVGPGGDGEIVVQNALPRGSGDAAKPGGACCIFAFTEQIGRGEDGRLREGLDQSPNRIEKCRQPFVIGVEEGDQVMPGLGDPAIAGGRDALVGLMDDSNSFVFDPPDRMRTFVGGTVVDDDDLEVLDSLRED